MGDRDKTMNWIDLHCDTPLLLYRQKQPLQHNSLHIDLEKSQRFSRFLQCAALYCPSKISDEDGFSYISEMASYFIAEIQKNKNDAMLIRTVGEWEAAKKKHLRGFLLTVEDGRILNRDLSCLDMLRSFGVRIFTPLWRGVSLLGGAHNTAVGLSDFGKDAVCKMLSVGILPDVSHASLPSFNDIAVLVKQAGKPLIATHSCAYALCPHTRNLRDAQIREIAESGGVIGVNLYPPFLSDGEATKSDVFRHIRYFLRIGGMECVSLGTDFDGVDALPCGISSLADMADFPDQMLKNGFSYEEVEHVFYRNAERIIKSILD